LPIVHFCRNGAVILLNGLVMLFSSRKGLAMSGKIFGLVALAALVVLAPQAEARRLYWWETQPRQYDQFDPNDNSYDPYLDSQDATAADMFNQDQYDRYQREMRRRHRWQGNGDQYDPALYDQNYDGGLADPGQPRYNDLQPKISKPLKPKKPKTVKAAVAKPSVDSTTVASANSTSTTTGTATITDPVTNPATVAPKTVEANPVEAKPVEAKPAATVAEAPKATKPVKGGKVTCAKGEEIVASYGFLDISQKSCEGTSLVYSAVRGKSNFEVEVNASSGEVMAVRKVS
jgi:hypothetical protein